ncbi:MAG TPA: PH domain-containing protein [Verrucomicrobiales bacterium]|nr:PH domain-containing protein [Verrucomicrobiales bacterium]
MLEHDAGQSPPSSPAVELPFEPLDSRVLGLFRLSSFIGALFLLTPASAILAVLTWQTLLPAWLAAIALTGFLALSAWLVFVYPRLHLRSWGFRIEDGVFELKHGVIVQRRVHIPLSRLQHVDIRRGPLERHLGLATLMLHTAGTSHALQTVPGLDPARAAQLRDRFLRFEGDDAV